MYVRETLPDNSREKGRSSTGKSDTHSNTQFHKSYLQKQLQQEKEKLQSIEDSQRAEREGEEEEEGSEDEYRPNEYSNEVEVGTDIEFNVSIKNIYDSESDLESGEFEVQGPPVCGVCSCCSAAFSVLFMSAATGLTC
jgi:hypothetical protein